MLSLNDDRRREVATLVDKLAPPGVNSVRFDASRLSSGVYYYRLTAGSFVASRPMLVLR
jgi:hypothetical protein